MHTFMDDLSTELVNWLFIAVGVGVLLFLGVAVAVVYYLLLFLALEYRHRQLLQEAGDTFDHLLDEHGNFAAQDVTRVVFDMPAPETEREHHTGELIFGIGVRADD
jgi:hypothetical protein